MKKLLNRAMSLLARRDYSEQELRRKLAAQSAFNPPSKYRNGSFSNDSTEVLSKEDLNDQIESVIQYCYEYHWLDDKKFTANFIRSRYSKGYGPQRIKSELKQKGIDKDILSAAFADCDIDWAELAQELIGKNFKHKALNDWKTRTKAYNYLANKGFYPDDISHALKKFII